MAFIIIHVNGPECGRNSVSLTVRVPKGLLWQLRPSDVEVELLAHTRNVVSRDLEEETGLHTGWIQNGGLFIASNKQRLDEYKRLMSVRPGSYEIPPWRRFRHVGTGFNVNMINMQICQGPSPTNPPVSRSAGGLRSWGQTTATALAGKQHLFIILTDDWSHVRVGTSPALPAMSL